MRPLSRLDINVMTSSDAKLVIAYNPASGHYRKERIDALVAAFEGFGFISQLVPTRPDGIDIPESAQLVCVAGGDGALRQVAHAMDKRLADVPIAVFPCGTVNLVARELGFANDPGAFAAQVAAAWRKGRESWPVSQLARHQGEPVMACLSIGPDSSAVSHFSPALKLRIGRLAYVVAFLKLLRAWPRYDIAMTATMNDGSERPVRGEAAFLSRAHYYAGPFTLNADAALGAEALQLVVMPRAGRLRAMAFALAVMAGIAPERLGLAKAYAVQSVRFDSCTYPVQVDGDFEGPCAGEVALTDIAMRFCI